MATGLSYSPIQIASRLGIGAFGLHLEEDGGVISRAELEVGFGRREIERVFRHTSLSLCLNYAERFDYLAAPAYNLCLASCFERLLGLDVPERANQIRRVLVEVNRISSHLHYFARLCRASGQISLTNHCLRERERFSDVMEMFCGSRLGFGAICLGGVIDDATDGWFFRIEKAITSLREFIPDLLHSLLEHPLFRDRAKGLAVVGAERALALAFSGPNARASGLSSAEVAADIGQPKLSDGRFFLPTDGDVYSRAWARLGEMEGSMELILDFFRQMPAGNHRIKVGLGAVAGTGIAFHEVQGPRGLISAAVECAGKSTPESIQFFSSSAMVVRALPELLRGVHVEDVFLVIQSLDISFSEVDK